MIYEFMLSDLKNSVLTFLVLYSTILYRNTHRIYRYASKNKEEF